MDKKNVGIIYDFDNTLSSGNMQDKFLIPSLGVAPNAFWQEADKLQKSQDMDKILAYMYLLLKKARDNGKAVTKEYLNQMGEKITFFPGVETWFKRINKFADTVNINLKHYIVSSGNLEIIEGSKIGKHIDNIYASKYMYDASGMAIWPALDINYTNKTQYIFRINKGIYDITDDSINNRIYSKAIPFDHLIYIGDGLTDVPCMALVHERNGLALAVYDTAKGQEIATSLLSDDRVSYIAKADYTKNSYIERLIMQKLTELSKEI